MPPTTVLSCGIRGLRGLLIYLGKNALQRKIFEARFDAEAFRRLVERAKILHQALLKDEEPTPNADKRECQFCEFKSECRGLSHEGSYGSSMEFSDSSGSVWAIDEKTFSSVGLKRCLNPAMIG